MNNDQALGIIEVGKTVPLSVLIRHRISRIFSDTRLWCVILINCIFFAYFLYMCLNTGLYGDDYGYRYVFAAGQKLTDNRVDSLAEVISSQAAHYRIMNGRSVAHFLLQTALIWDDRVFSVINAVMYTLLGVGMYLHTLSASDRAASRHRPFSALAVYLVPWILFPEYGDVFHIECLAANYVWTMTIIIWFLLPYRLLLEECDVFSRFRSTAAVCALMFLAGTAAGWSSENGSAAALFMIGCMGLYFLLKKRSFPLWCAAGFAGAVFGFAMMLLAPGYRIRVDGTARTSLSDRLSAIVSLHTMMPYGCFIIIIIACACFMLYTDTDKKRQSASRFAAISAGIIITVFFINLALSGHIAQAYIDLLLCAAAAAVFIYLLRAGGIKRARPGNILPLCYLAAAACANLVLVAVPYVQQRNQLPFLLLLTISAAMIFERVLERIGRRARLRGIKPVFILVLMIYSVISLHSVSIKTHRDYQQFLAMEQSIYNSRAAGVTDIILEKPDLCGDRRVAGLWMTNNDPDYWINQAMCQYYDIDSVYHCP